MKSADTDGGNFYSSPTFNTLRESYQAVDPYGYIGDALSPVQANKVPTQLDELMMTLHEPTEGSPLRTIQQEREASSADNQVRREISF